MPGCKDFGSGPKKNKNASSSFKVERLGAARGNFSRAMPIGQGEELPGRDRPTYTVVELMKNKCSRGAEAFALASPASTRARLSGPSNRRRKPASSLASLVSAVSSQTSENCRDSRAAACSKGPMRPSTGRSLISGSTATICRAKHSSANGNSLCSAAMSAAAYGVNST